MIRSYFLLFLLLMAVAAGAIAADDAPPAEGRRYTIGVRVQAFPLRLFEIQDVSVSTTKPVADYTYTASTQSQKAALTPSLEYRLTSHLTVGSEFLLHHAQYRQKEEMRSGKRDPNASTDDRQVNTTTQTTRANYWEFPVLLRYHGLRKSGLLSKTYVVAGLGYRHVGRVRTGTEYSYADGTTDYNEAPARADRREQFGAIFGVGLRFVDDFKIKVTPEFRFMQWQGSTLQGVAYRSVTNELRAGLGIAF